MRGVVAVLAGVVLALPYILYARRRRHALGYGLIVADVLRTKNLRTRELRRLSYNVRMKRLLPLPLLLAACAHVAPPSCDYAPAADHHQHLLSAEAAKLGGNHPLAPAAVPPELAR